MCRGPGEGETWLWPGNWKNFIAQGGCVCEMTHAVWRPWLVNVSERTAEDAVPIEDKSQVMTIFCVMLRRLSFILKAVEDC